MLDKHSLPGYLLVKGDKDPVRVYLNMPVEDTSVYGGVISAAMMGVFNELASRFPSKNASKSTQAFYFEDNLKDIEKVFAEIISR